MWMCHTCAIGAQMHVNLSPELEFKCMSISQYAFQGATLLKVQATGWVLTV